MAYKFFPHTRHDLEVMLERAGVKTIDDLFADIPSELQFKREYELPDEMSELDVRRFFDELGLDNYVQTCMVGAGFYEHYAPSVIQSILSRSEFLTSYTPYQAEISQGTLQYIFEYQSMMAELTGMEVSNASMYDGTTATAEAMMMAVASAKKRDRVLVSETVSPLVLRVLRTYGHFHGVRVDTIAAPEGVTSVDDMKAKLAEGDVAAVIVATPNFYGIVEDYTGFAEAIHEAKALLIMHCNASALAVVKTPGEWGADIAVGDGQSLGVPLSYGGPTVGFLCASKKLIRKMPGRIVGATTDAEGRRAFVLTLQAREQHIRREKATSNICSNQSLMALYVTLYLSLMGKQGLREVNELSYSAAHYLADKLVATGHFKMTYPDKPFINEFAVTLTGEGDVKTLQARLSEEGFELGYAVNANTLVIYVGETATRADLDELVDLTRLYIEEPESINNTINGEEDVLNYE